MKLQDKQIPNWIGAALVVGGVLSLFWLEWRRPLRRSTDSKLQRNIRNGLIGVSAAVAVQLMEAPVSRRMSQMVERHQYGLVKKLRLPAWLEVTLALVLMDYTLYLWHVLAHRLPLLWRFHAVHHADVDLDVSTGLRFHFGELALSAPYRAAQILIIGVSPLSLFIWQLLMLLLIAFHHSNVELPPNLERKLVRFLVTPRMHGIHHSMIPEETNSNWSSGLSFWDRLHKTMRLNIPQRDLTIGLSAYRESMRVPEALLMPFVCQKPEWILPTNGIPARTPAYRSQTFLEE